MINELKMRYFLTLVKHLNYTRAAEELFITQQALSKQIAALEKDLDCQLLKHVGKRMYLTDSGESYAECFDKMLTLYEQTQSRVNRQRHQRQKLLNFGCLSGMTAGAYIRRRCDEFIKRNPGLSFWVGTVEDWRQLTQMVLTHQFDFVIYPESRSGTELPPEAERILLVRSKLYMFVSKDYPINGDSEPLTQVHDLFFYAPVEDGLSAKLMNEFREIGMPPTQIVGCANMESAILQTELGNAVCFGNCLSTCFENPNLKAYPLRQEDNVYLCYHRQAGELMAQLTEYLAEQCE